MTTNQGPSDSRVFTCVAQNFTEFKTAIAHLSVPIQVTSDHAHSFRARIHSSSSDELHVSGVSATRHIVSRTPELIAQGGSHRFKINLQLAGTGLLIQENREALLHPGDLTLYDTGKPYSLIFDGDSRCAAITFPQRLLDVPSEKVGQLAAVRISGQSGIASAILPAVMQLAANLGRFTAMTDSRLARSTLDLVSAVFAEELGIDGANADPRAALVWRIRQYIEMNLTYAELGPAQIASAHFISTRHLHNLFKEDGTTVSSWIRFRRLSRCRFDLTDAAKADQTISMIAARWGFLDAAHFSRTFKAAYGVSPSQVRESLLTSSPSASALPSIDGDH